MSDMNNNVDEQMQRAMNPTLGQALMHYKRMLFPQDMSLSTVFAVNVNKIAIAAIQEKIDRDATYTWERMENAFGELEGFMCKCGYSSNSASHYCPNCGHKMED